MSGLEKRTVLIVDDDADARDALARFLEIHGYQPFEAANGREAIERLNTIDHWPKLILLDLDMPVMNGREFLSRMQQLHPGPAAPAVVVITGQDPRTIPGATAVLRKPVPIPKLLGLMQRLMPEQTDGEA